MDLIQNIWNTIVDFLSHVSFGSILAYMSMGAGIFFGIDRWRLSHRKPKASLRFANGKKEITLDTHHYSKSSSKYYLIPSNDSSLIDRLYELMKKYAEKHEDDNAFRLTFRLFNSGELQLENYRVEIEFDKGMGKVHSSLVYHLRKVGATVEEFPPDGLNLDNYSNPQVVYTPVEDCPLNQKDSKQFTFVFIPSSKVNQVVLRWRIIAKDFNDHGKFKIRLKPYYTTDDEIKPVYREQEIPEGAETVENLTPFIQQFEELLKH